MLLKISASRYTMLRSCRGVAPMDASRPNCFVRSLTEMAKELYTRDTPPVIIRRIRITDMP